MERRARSQLADVDLRRAYTLELYISTLRPAQSVSSANARVTP